MTIGDDFQENFCERLERIHNTLHSINDCNSLNESTTSISETLLVQFYDDLENVASVIPDLVNKKRLGKDDILLFMDWLLLKKSYINLLVTFIILRKVLLICWIY